MFTVKVVSRFRIDNAWFENKHLMACDYVDIRSGYNEISVTGRMADGAIAVEAAVKTTLMPADKDMNAGDKYVSHIIIENIKGRTTEVIRSPREFEMPHLVGASDKKKVE